MTHRSPRRDGAFRAGVTAALLTALVGSLASAPAQAVSSDPDLFCDLPGQELALSPISGLQDGDDVTWLSTVKGTTPTAFTGEYVGKLDNGLGYDGSGQPRDLLLVKLDGEVVNGTGSTLPAGVWAGASGSPVYDADGALIGAVSYGFSSLADNVAGVTPAAYMKAIGRLPGQSAQLPLEKTLSASATRQLARMLDVAPPAASAAPTKMRRLEPVRVSTGAPAGTLDAVSAKLAKNVDGFTPVAAAGRAIDGGASSGADYPIVAGGNIAVSYAYGAVAEASVGTVTAVCGDEVFAYGHPSNWNSKLGASFHGASAARIVPELGASYKMVSAIGKVKGTLVDDRLAGVRGLLGAGADTVPIATRSTLGSHVSRAVSHVSEKLLVGPAVAAQLAGDAARMLDNQWAGSAKVAWTITYQRENGRIATLKNINSYADPQFFPELVGYEVAEDIAALQSNTFEDVEILKVGVSARFSEDVRASRVSGVQMLQKGTWKTVRPGSVTKVTRGATYSFRTVLSPMPGAERVTEYQPFTVTVSKALKKTMKITVKAPPYIPIFEMGFPESFSELVALLDARPRMDVVERTRSWVSTGGVRYTPRSLSVAPTLVSDAGKRIAFLLEAAPKR